MDKKDDIMRENEKVICGLKLTHDGAICLIDGNKLIFSIEMEKIRNNSRHSPIEDLSLINEICNQYNYKLSDIDIFAVDGWWDLVENIEHRDNKNPNQILIKNNGIQETLRIGYYSEYDFGEHFTNALNEWKFTGLPIGENTYSYSSYMHVTGHIMSSYCTSPFAAKHQNSYVLVWDGGISPQLYLVDADKRTVKSYGSMYRFAGNIYAVFASFFDPFKADVGTRLYDLSVSGKIMAYIALGNNVPEIQEHLSEIYDACKRKNLSEFEVYFSKKAASFLYKKDYRHEDVLCSFHYFLQTKHIEALEKYTDCNISKNICISGGCGLNIKWNSAIRNSNLFENVYVSPFPNDAGSAIGAACTALYLNTNYEFVQYDVYSGPSYIVNKPADGWSKKPFTVKQLAQFLYEKEEPVVVQNGRAELGPRALGNRSIIGVASNKQMKDQLNRIKKREYYRPVSPICMEEYAPNIFEPGTPDPYMLFDHTVKDEWKDRIPAVCHLDGSARLQTISRKQNEVIYDLLYYYESISGLPLLCNTSANYLGKGFFPDIDSVTQWGGVNYVWCDDVLYFRT